MRKENKASMATQAAAEPAAAAAAAAEPAAVTAEAARISTDKTEVASASLADRTSAPDDANAREEKARRHDDDPNYPHGLKLVLIITALCLAVFLVALDQTIIAPALGAITGQFQSVKDIVRNQSPALAPSFSSSSPLASALPMLTLTRARKRGGTEVPICSPRRPCSPCTAPCISSSTSSWCTWAPSSSSSWAAC